MVGSLTGEKPVGMVYASGPEVSPLVAVVAVFMHMDMEGDVGGDMRDTFVNFGCAGVKMIVKHLLKFVEVLFIFFFLEVLIGTKWEQNDAL
jgi:hypothetical protein